MVSNREITRTINRQRFALRICVCLIAISLETVWADIAPDPLSGGKNLAIRGREKTKVAMVDEIVKLRVSRDTCQTDVVFTMKNIGTKAETMQVGFPYYYPDEMNGFQAIVDGKPIEVANATDKGTKGTLDEPGSYPVHWKTWNTTFAPDQPVKVAVSYSTKLKERDLLTQFDEFELYALRDLLQKDDQPRAKKKFASRNLEYILVTGSHWSGPIGRCRIEVTLQEMTTENLAFGSPSFEKQKAVITQDKIVWDLKDYEPQGNVQFTLTPDLTRTDLLKLLEQYRKKQPHEPNITRILSGLLVEAKRESEADRILLELLTHWQDKIALWGSDTKPGQSLQQSHEVFSLITRKIKQDRPLKGFHNPSPFVPVIERIARRVQGQLKFAPSNQADQTKDFTNQIEKLLEWCRSHARSE